MRASTRNLSSLVGTAAFLIGLSLSGDALAQAGQTLEKSLFAQIAQRWLDIVESREFPAFLKTRTDSEPIEMGAAKPADFARALLHADHDVFFFKISDMFGNGGPYYGLTHQTKEKHVLDFLRTGQMIPRSGRHGDNAESDSQPGVYMELTRRIDPKTFQWGPVELMFRYEILDRTDYILNPAWNFGRYDLYSASPAVARDKGRVKFYLEKYFTQIAQNEVVFTQPVSTAFLVKITVRRGQRANLLQQIRVLNLRPPAGWKNWEENIVEK